MADAMRGAGQPLTVLNPYQVSVTYNAQGAGWFGPLNPIKPIAPPQVAGRQIDFPVGYNLAIQPRAYEAVTFGTLRALADGFDLLRIVIETRKDQLARLSWLFRVKGVDKFGRPKQATPGQQSKIDELTAFWKRPDGEHRWRAWFRAVLEDVFVIDAPTLYCERSRGGKLLGLQYLDGGTIKRVIDDWGRTPKPFTEGGKKTWPVAYQEVLKGFPAVDYTTRDIVYRPYNLRPHKIYGYSPVEQIIMTVNIALRRQMFQLSYYTEGNVPEALIGTPDTWTPDQVAAFQTYWDTLLTGNLAQRRHAKFVPGGVAKTYLPTKEPDLTNPMDEWLARIICFAFSISPQQFVRMMNRATAQTAGDQSKEEGIEPIKEWTQELVSDISETEFGADDIEFTFEEEVEVDQEKQTNILAKQVEDGAIPLNEFREALGKPPSDNPAADMLMVKTATGYVPIEANTLDGKKEAMDVLGPPVVPGQNPDDPQGAGANGEPAKPGKPAVAKKPAKGDAEVGKAAAAPFVAKRSTKWKRLPAIKYQRPSVRKAIKAITAIYTKAFKAAAKTVAASLRDELDKVAKDSPKSRAKTVAERAKLDPLDKVQADVESQLEDIASEAGYLALAQLGVDDSEELVDQVNAAAVTIARENAAELVSGIDETTRDGLRDLIARGLEDNVGLDEIIESIQDWSGFSADRADLIARTEVTNANSRAALAGYKAASDDGVAVKKEWELGPDPCEICQENADEGPIDLDDEFPSGDTEPAAHPNCLPGDAMVVARNILGATKRWYDGDLVVIYTAGGKQLRCTPNHPVLTPHGWVAARLLNKGGDVISANVIEGKAALILDDDDMPSCIEDVAESFGRAQQVTAMPVPLSAEDFHGDGIGSEVAIVWADRMLVNAANAALGKHARKLALGLVDVKLPKHDGARAGDLFFERMDAADNCKVRSLGALASNAGCELSGGNHLRLRLVTAQDAALDKSRRNYAPADSEFSGDGLLAHSADVQIGNLCDGHQDLPRSDLRSGSLEGAKDNRTAHSGFPSDLRCAGPAAVSRDTIVSKRLIRFSGHVFNLQTQSGWYLADGVVTHNCECAIAPVVEENAVTDDSEDEE